MMQIAGSVSDGDMQADFISKFDAFDKVKNALRRADFTVCGSRGKAINADLYSRALHPPAKVCLFRCGLREFCHA